MAFEQAVDAAGAVAPADDVADAIGVDERRMHVRAYNYWCSLLDGRDYPSIEDLEPGEIDDFGPHSVLLDFTEGVDDPATPFIGTAIRTECGLDADIKHISDVPGRSLLSRLTDHYMQIIANRAPVGFEAEFTNQRGHNICYRGILMPFSSDGDTIDFIYGVINWKDEGSAPDPNQSIQAALPPLEHEAVDDEDVLELDALLVPDIEPGDHIAWEDGPLAEDAEPVAAEIPAAEAGLADWLCAARESAEVCKAADGRSRAALYQALALAYDFAVAAQRVPEEYQEILDDAGVRAQERAPMTPVVKLVFGIDYDKTRLTEFAAALAYAHRCAVDFGGFQQFVEAADGGLKGLVKEERKARRGDAPSIDRAAVARDKLRHAPGLAQPSFEGEYGLMVARRNDDGSVSLIAEVADATLLDRALVKAAK